MQDHNMQMHLVRAVQFQVSMAAVAACNSTASSHTSVYSYCLFSKSVSTFGLGRMDTSNRETIK